MRLRAHHLLVGEALVDLDTVLDEAPSSSRALWARARRLADHRIACARAIAEAVERLEAAPYSGHEVGALPASPEALTVTDLARALIAEHPELWGCFCDVPGDAVAAISDRWRSVGDARHVSEPSSVRLALQPTLARRLSWARKARGSLAPRDLFDLVCVDAGAAFAEHLADYQDGLITRSEAIVRLFDRLVADGAGTYFGPMPPAHVDDGSLRGLTAAVEESTRESPVIVVRGPEGSGRGALTRAAFDRLRHSSRFAGWGFNIDNFHGGVVDPVDAPAVLAVSHRCVASYGRGGVETLEQLARSVLHRPEDARLILRVDEAALTELCRRLPALEGARVVDVHAADMRTRVAVLVAHMLALNDWFGMEWGLREAIWIASQIEDRECLEFVLACAGQAAAREFPERSYELACARSFMRLPDRWLFAAGHASELQVRARERVAAPGWKTSRRKLRYARRFARAHPEDYAMLVELAKSLHLSA